MIKKLFELAKNYYGFFVVLFLATTVVLIPFLISNSLNGFDSPGHVLAAYFIKNYFWPWPDGWNMMTLSGYPQGLLYPSFFHWLTAALNFIVPLDLAIKILVSLSILAVPILVFILAKKIFKDIAAASFTAVLVSIFYFYDTGLNCNMFTDLFFGMLSHLFSLALFFLYLLFLFILINDNKSWRLPSLVLALSLITHIITGSVVIGLGFIAFILAKNGTKLKNALFKHLLFGLIISSFWWLPFAINIGYVTGSDATSMSSTFLVILSPLILFMNFFIFKIKNENAIFFKAISLLSSLIMITCFLSNFLTVDSVPIHFYRFFPYAIFVVPFLFTYLLINKFKIRFTVANLIATCCFLFYIFFLRIIPVGPFETDLLNKLETKYQNGRVIVNGFSKKLDARFHSIRMSLPLKKNIPTFEGLFVESSLNGWYIMSLMNSYDYAGSDNTFVWAYTNLQNVDNLAWASRIFGVNYEYHYSDISPKEEVKMLSQKLNTLDDISDYQTTSVEKAKQKNNLLFHLQKTDLLDDEGAIKLLGGDRSGFYYQTFYKINNTGLVETLPLRPINISKDWDKNVKNWWTTDWLKIPNQDSYIYDKPMLVYNTDTSSWLLSDQLQTLPLTINKKMDSFVVDGSNLSHPEPIYIKIGYFPFWKAYDQNNNELKIFKTSPNFMLVYANGPITFKYEKPWYYYGAYILSGLGLLFIFSSWFFKRKK